MENLVARRLKALFLIGVSHVSARHYPVALQLLGTRGFNSLRDRIHPDVPATILRLFLPRLVHPLPIDDWRPRLDHHHGA
jgi:hypothetical protein